MLAPDGPAVELRYLSPDGEEGFPGNLRVLAVYTLTHDNGLRLDFTATTDQDTIVNLTHHSYFNLAGRGDVLHHFMQINADQFTPVDSTLIPTGRLQSVAGTPFDFRRPAAIGARIEQNDEQLKLGHGYDHNFVINGGGKSLVLAARVRDPQSGRVMELRTTEPGVQLYTGNPRGFCLETQHYPDSIHHPNFPSTVLRPGETFKSTTEYSFSAR